MAVDNAYSEAFQRAKRFLLREMGRPDAQAILNDYLSMLTKVMSASPLSASSLA